jgi:hypothetical protein
VDELNKQKPSGDMPFKYLPMFVRFRDLHDPATVEQVDPTDVAAGFGAGVKLERLRIEITDAAVTKNIEKVLPWLANRDSPRLSARPLAPSNNPAVELLNYDDLRIVSQ